MVAAVASIGNNAALCCPVPSCPWTVESRPVFWPRAIGEEEAVAELLFRLVSVLLPSVDSGCCIPKVCHGYFELWQFLVDLYPGRVATCQLSFRL